jgi:ABC-type Fe3+-hydroxamate transport system substrate-binding protein
MSIDVVDATGRRVRLPVFPSRIISLVPSITETLFVLGLGERLVGVTRYCTEPSASVAQKPKVGEENRREDVEALAAMGIAVYTTYPRTVEEGITMIRDLGRVTRTEERAGPIARSLEEVYREISAEATRHKPVRIFCPIWRRPYMSINRDTYVHDVLRICGGENIFAGKSERYPQISLAEVADLKPEVILLPDEPYRFLPRHMDDFKPCEDVIPALMTGRVHFIDGKLLSWYGPRIGESLRALWPLLLC